MQIQRNLFVPLSLVRESVSASITDALSDQMIDLDDRHQHGQHDHQHHHTHRQNQQRLKQTGQEQRAALQLRAFALRRARN